MPGSSLASSARGLDAPRPVLAQRALLEGVLDNALRYGHLADGSAARDTLEVASDVQGGVRLSVCDNGPGIGEAQRERLHNRWAWPSWANTRGFWGRL